MCPTCHTTLDQSDSPAAQQIRVFIAQRIAACWTTQQIESALVANYGQGILAAPSHKGFDLLAWWLPIVGVLAGAVVLAFGVWRWSRRKEPRSRTSRSAAPASTRRRSVGSTNCWHASTDGRRLG